MLSPFTTPPSTPPSITPGSLSTPPSTPRRSDSITSVVSNDKDDDTNVTSSSRLSKQGPAASTTSSNLEDDPYYKKLMGCSCAKTSDAKGVPTISRTGKGPSNGKPPPTSSSGEGGPSRTGAVSNSNVQTRYPIRPGTNYVDHGNNITGANKENYNNRCFIISLADILGYTTNAEYLQFYQNIVTAFNAYYATLNEAKKNVGLRKLNDDLQMVANRQSNDGYIEAPEFFKVFQICELNRTGIIYSQPTMGGDLIFNSSGAVQQVGREFTNGFYIPPLNQDGTLGEITVNTPIIYNQGMGHFVTGIGEIDKNMLNAIKRNGPYLLTYTDSEIKIPNKDGNCIPELTEEQKVKLYNSLNATSNCKFKMGDYIIYKDIEYIVLDHRNDYESNCSSYIVCTSDGDPVVSIITNIANIKSSPKPTLLINAVLARVHSSGKYSEIVQADDGKGTLVDNITIPGKTVNSLTQLGGGKTRKHRRTRKTRKSRKTIKKRKITKKRKTRRK